MDTVIQTRVSGKLKTSAEVVFAQMGMSLSEAIRIFLHQAVMDNGLPFNPMVRKNSPSAELMTAIADVSAGKADKIGSSDDVKQYLLSKE